MFCDYAKVSEAREGIDNYMDFYNQERLHHSLDYKTPAEVYFGSNNQKKGSPMSKEIQIIWVEKLLASLCPEEEAKAPR